MEQARLVPQPQPIHTIAAASQSMGGRILEEIRKPVQPPIRKPRAFCAQDGLWRGWVECGDRLHNLTLCPTDEPCGEGVLLLRGVPGRSRSLVATRDGQGHLVLELGNGLSETDIRRLANQIVADVVSGRIRTKQPPAPRSASTSPRRKKNRDPHDQYSSLFGGCGYYS